MHTYETIGVTNQVLVDQPPAQEYSDHLTTRRTVAKSATRQASLKD